MTRLSQAHPSLVVSDPAAFQAALAVLGFTDILPSQSEDAARLVRNPATGQEVALSQRSGETRSGCREGCVSVGVEQEARVKLPDDAWELWHDRRGVVIGPLGEGIELVDAAPEALGV